MFNHLPQRRHSVDHRIFTSRGGIAEVTYLVSFTPHLLAPSHSTTFSQHKFCVVRLQRGSKRRNLAKRPRSTIIALPSSARCALITKSSPNVSETPTQAPTTWLASYYSIILIFAPCSRAGNQCCWVLRSHFASTFAVSTTHLPSSREFGTLWLCPTSATSKSYSTLCPRRRRACRGAGATILRSPSCAN